VFVLEQNDKTYFALGSPEQDFPGLKNEAFNTHAEDNASNAGYGRYIGGVFRLRPPRRRLPPLTRYK
jgi:hypothetical protein